MPLIPRNIRSPLTLWNLRGQILMKPLFSLIDHVFSKGLKVLSIFPCKDLLWRIILKQGMSPISYLLETMLFDQLFLAPSWVPNQGPWNISFQMDEVNLGNVKKIFFMLDSTPKFTIPLKPSPPCFGYMGINDNIHFLKPKSH